RLRALPSRSLHDALPTSVLLGHFFDSVGRKPMITLAYLGSALVTLPLAWVFLSQAGGLAAFMILRVVTFFLASSGASAAYLTVIEIFPMETRARAIAFFYAVVTAAGGIVGPLLFGTLIAPGGRFPAAVGFLGAAAVMSLGGLAELLFGVRAEGRNLEDLATPLTAEDADAAAGDGTGGSSGPPGNSGAGGKRADGGP